MISNLFFIEQATSNVSMFLIASKKRKIRKELINQIFEKEITLRIFVVGLPRDVHHILLYKSRAKCFNQIRNGP